MIKRKRETRKDREMVAVVFVFLKSRKIEIQGFDTTTLKCAIKKKKNKSKKICEYVLDLLK
jgi:hypothetical protein